MAEVYTSEISLTFTIATVTKWLPNEAENRKLTILEQSWDVWQRN